MGKGTISAEIGLGEYTIDLDYGSSLITQQIASKHSLFASFEASIAAL